MKNTCKKLFSLMLAVVLLVSVVPFQASAAMNEIPVDVYINGELVPNANKTVALSDTPTYFDQALAEKIVTTWHTDDYDREYVGWGDNQGWSTATSVDPGWQTIDSCPEGYRLFLELKETPKQKPPVVNPVTVPVKTFINGKEIATSKSITVGADKKIIDKALAESLVDVMTNRSFDCWKDSEGQTWTNDGWLDAQWLNENYPNGGYTLSMYLTEKTPDTYYNVNVKVNGKDAKVVSVKAGDKLVIDNAKMTGWGWSSDAYDFNGLGTYTITENTEINITATAKPNKGDGGNSKNYNKVYLNIFMDGNFKDRKEVRIDEREQIAYDGYVSKAEVESVIMKYYKAKDSYGIDVDGIYVHTGNVMDKWQKNDKVNAVDNIYDLKENGNVYLSVWIDNAVAKTPSKADSSNPKTGDEIFVTVTIMAVTATALAGAYFFNKKRMAQ